MLTCMPSEDSALLGRNVLCLLLSARRRESGSRLPIGSHGGLTGERCGACVREGVMVLEQGDARRDGGSGLLPNHIRVKFREDIIAYRGIVTAPGEPRRKHPSSRPSLPEACDCPSPKGYKFMLII